MCACAVGEYKSFDGWPVAAKDLKNEDGMLMFSHMIFEDLNL